MTNNDQSKLNQNWTSKQLIHFSQNLSQAYGIGLNRSTSSQKTDTWTTEKFINMSRSLASAYGIEF